MYNDTLTEKVFARVRKNVEKVMNDKRFYLRNFGDWNVQVCVPCTEITSWDNGSIMEHFGEETMKFGEMDKDRAMFHFLSSVFSNAYAKGVVGCGCSKYRLPRTARLDAFRNEVIALKKAVGNAGYSVDNSDPSCEYLYIYNSKDFKDGWYITMLLKSKELEEWRDMMYRGYSQSDECRLEHQMERRAEIQFEDMVMGTHNL